MITLTDAEYDGLKARIAALEAALEAALRNIESGAKRHWYPGDDAYQFAILAAKNAAPVAVLKPDELLSWLNK